MNSLNNPEGSEDIDLIGANLKSGREKMRKAVMLCLGSCLVIVLLAGVVEANNCSGLVGGKYAGTPTGKWTATLKFLPSGQVFAWLQGRGEYTGSCTGRGKFTVNFTDDPGCCRGGSDDGGRTIRWSNGGVWYRVAN